MNEENYLKAPKANKIYQDQDFNINSFSKQLQYTKSNTSKINLRHELPNNENLAKVRESKSVKTVDISTAARSHVSNNTIK